MRAQASRAPCAQANEPRLRPRQNSPLQYLRELKRTKKNKMKEIIRTMESFNNNLQGGKKLVKSLEKQSVRLGVVGG